MEEMLLTALGADEGETIPPSVAPAGQSREIVYSFVTLSKFPAMMNNREGKP